MEVNQDCVVEITAGVWLDSRAWANGEYAHLYVSVSTSGELSMLQHIEFSASATLDLFLHGTTMLKVTSGTKIYVKLGHNNGVDPDTKNAAGYYTYVTAKILSTV